MKNSRNGFDSREGKADASRVKQRQVDLFATVAYLLIARAFSIERRECRVI